MAALTEVTRVELPDIRGRIDHRAVGQAGTHGTGQVISPPEYDRRLDAARAAERGLRWMHA